MEEDHIQSNGRSGSESGEENSSKEKSPSCENIDNNEREVSPISDKESEKSASRSRSGSRSRSRSHSPSRSKSRSPSQSRSRSSTPRGRNGRRNRSHSPMSSRRRHIGDRDAPTESKCIGIFGLSLYTQERDLKEHFSQYGPIDECQLVYDHQTGRSRGFAFIYYKNLEDAIDAKERASGTELDGRRIRVDYSITKRAHTPTPGIYLGKSSDRRRDDRRRGGGFRDRDRRYDDDGGYYRESFRDSYRERRCDDYRERRCDDYRRRSPSPYYKRGYSRSRSRSYSPRRY